MASQKLREIFINNLRFYRTQKHLSQEKLSYAIDKSMNYVNQIENKNTWPQPEVVEQICEVLDIRPSWLFEESGSPQNIAAFNKDEFISRVTTEMHSLMKKDMEQILSREHI